MPTSTAKWLRRLLKSNVLAMGGWRADGRFTAFNDALLKLIGYSRREIDTGKVLLWDLTPPEYSHLGKLAIQEAQLKGECTPFEEELLRKDGRRVPVLVGGSIYGGGIIDAGAFFAVDLSKRKLASSVKKYLVPPEIQALTDRQRAVCLLLSYGEPEKRIAGLLDLSVRTVELDKHRIAEQLGIPITKVIVWTVENRQGLVTSLRGNELMSDSLAKIVRRYCN